MSDRVWLGPWRFYNQWQGSRNAKRGNIDEAIRCYMISCFEEEKTVGNRLVGDAREILNDNVELAKKLLERAGDLGEPIGYNDLGHLLRKTYTADGAVETDEQKELVNSYYEKGAALGSLHSMRWLVSRVGNKDPRKIECRRKLLAGADPEDNMVELNNLAVTLFNAGQFEESLPICQQLADTRQGMGFLLLGIAYNTKVGRSLPYDPKEAFRCFQAAIDCASSESAEAASDKPPAYLAGALCRLGHLYEDGTGVQEKDQAKALVLYERSAALGGKHAALCLGKFYTGVVPFLQYVYHRDCGSRYHEKQAEKLRKKSPELVAPWGRFSKQFFYLVPNDVQQLMVNWMLASKVLTPRLPREIALMIVELICSKPVESRPGLPLPTPAATPSMSPEVDEGAI